MKFERHKNVAKVNIKFCVYIQIFLKPDAKRSYKKTKNRLKKTIIISQIQNVIKTLQTKNLLRNKASV